MGLGEARVMLPVQGVKKVTDVDAADDEADRRHHHVGHERRHDPAKGGPDDDADRQVDHVAADRELLEFLPHGRRWYTRRSRGFMALLCLFAKFSAGCYFHSTFCPWGPSKALYDHERPPGCEPPPAADPRH